VGNTSVICVSGLMGGLTGLLRGHMNICPGRRAGRTWKVS
jgi:hypothetical protein